MYNNTYLVIYQKPGSSTQYKEVTSNLELTIETLKAQGYIIIDIIDI